MSHCNIKILKAYSRQISFGKLELKLRSRGVQQIVEDLLIAAAILLSGPLLDSCQDKQASLSLASVRAIGPCRRIKDRQLR